MGVIVTLGLLWFVAKCLLDYRARMKREAEGRRKRKEVSS